MSMSIKKLELVPLIIAGCAFCLLHPWFLWGISNYVRFGFFPALYLLATVPNLDLRSHSRFPMFISLFALLVFVCLIQGFNIAYSFSILSLCVVPFLKEDVFRKALYYFEVILAVFLGGGVFVQILLLLDIPLSGYYLAPLNEEFYMGYTVYPPFLVVRNGIFDVFRFFGPFDEPGVVGTVSVFVLYCERYNMKKWYNLLIFIGAIFSFSFMFIAASLLYIVFAYIKKPSKAIFLVLLIASFYAVTKDIPQFKQAVYDRFEWDAAAGKFEGDKRYGDSQKEYIESIRGTSDYFFGDHGKSEGEFVGARSYMDAIIRFGFVFCFLYIVWFVAFARMKKLSWYHTFVFLAILLLNLYQRPNFLSYSYMFLYTSFILNWRAEEQLNGEKKYLK